MCSCFDFQSFRSTLNISNSKSRPRNLILYYFLRGEYSKRILSFESRIPDNTMKNIMACFALVWQFVTRGCSRKKGKPVARVEISVDYPLKDVVGRPPSCFLNDQTCTHVLLFHSISPFLYHRTVNRRKDSRDFYIPLFCFSFHCLSDRSKNVLHMAWRRINLHRSRSTN